MRQATQKYTAGMLFLLAIAGAAPSFAQQPGSETDPFPADWEYAVAPDGRSHVAAVSFTSGVTLAVRCYLPDVLMVSFSGLPLEPEAAYTATATRDNGRAWRGRFIADPNGVASVSHARRISPILRGGGRLSFWASGKSGPPVRLEVELPTGHVNLDRTLLACGVRLATS